MQQNDLFKPALAASLLVVCATLSLASCGGKDKPDGGTCDGADTCEFPWDCAVGFSCNKDGCCEEFGCTPDSCGTGQFCDEDGACKSIADKCALEDCACYIVNGAGELEADGEPRISLAPGASMTLRAVLAVKGGNALPGASFTFEAASTPAGNAAAFDGLFTLAGATLTAKSTSAGSAILRARASEDVSCEAELQNLGTAGSGVRAYVFNDVTGAPVDAATVVFDFDNDGSGEQTVTTSSAGVATATSTPSGAYTVSVFKNGYNFLSVVGLSASASDLVLPLSERLGDVKTGGFTGKMRFDEYEKVVLGAKKTVQAGIVASSFPLKSILNFDLSLLAGSFGDVDCDANPNQAGCYAVPLDPIINDVLPLPGGLVLNLQTRTVKPFFDSVGIPGRRYAWALAGEVDINDLNPLLSLVTPVLNCECNATENACDSGCSCDGDCPGGGNIDIGAVMNAFMPFFANFGSGVKGDLPLDSVPFDTWTNFIEDPFEDRVDAAGNFPVLDDGAGNYGRLSPKEPMRQLVDFTMPNLPTDPRISGQAFEGMLVISGVNTVGYGFVPLGLGIGIDCQSGEGIDCFNRSANPSAFNGKVNGGTLCVSADACPPNVPPTVGEGHIGMFHAAAHGGLEGQEWVTLVIAAPVSSMLDDSSFGVRATAFVQRGALARSTNFSSKQFAGFPAMPATTTGRSYAISSASDIDVHWITIANEAQRWNVYLANPGATTTFRPPALPGGISGDPFAPDVDSKIDVTHIGFQLESGTQLETLVRGQGGTLVDMVSKLEGFSVQSTKVTVQ